MIDIGNIITLDNNEEYLVLEQIEEEGKKYIYTVKVLEDDKPSNDSLIFEVLVDTSGEYVRNIDDKELYDDLLDEFKDIVAEKLIDLDKEINTQETA